MPDAHTHYIEWADLRRRMKRWLEGKAELSTDPATLRSVGKSEWDNWKGCTKSDMKDWLTKGYKPDKGKALFGVATSIVRTPTLISHESEGELMLSEAYAGSDEPYLTYEPRPRRPGLRILFDMSANANTSSETLTRFISGWYGPLLMRLETEGYDLELDVANFGKNTFVNSDGREDVVIRVKRANEVISFTSISPLFAPGSFRTLGFLSLGMAAEKAGTECDHSFGQAVGNSWKLEFDSHTRTLKILTPSSWGDAPVDEFDDTLRSVGLLGGE